MPPLKTSASDMVKNARAKIEEIETPDLITMMDDPNVILLISETSESVSETDTSRVVFMPREE